MKEKKSRYIPTLWKEEIIEKQHKKCIGKDCAKEHGGKKKDITIYADFDHDIPLAMEGKNIKSNIKAYCHDCHARKTRKDRERIKKWKEKKKGKKKKGRKRKTQKQKQVKINIPKVPYNPPLYKF